MMGRRVEEEEKKKKKLKKSFQVPTPQKKERKGERGRGVIRLPSHPPPSFLLLNKVFLGFVIMENIYIYINIYIHTYGVSVRLCGFFSFPELGWLGPRPLFEAETK